jgi:tRNA(Ile2) C34 agmatinyltransferase TiaS
MKRYRPPPVCPTCNGPLAFLGDLGNRRHFRCVQCGMEVSKRLPPKRSRSLDRTVNGR